MNITTFLKKVKSSNILGAVNSGMNNEVYFSDKFGKVTEIARIDKDTNGQASHVRLSAAFCQYFWIVTDIALKLIDKRIIEASCLAYNIPVEKFLEGVNQTNSMTIDQILPHMPDFFKPMISKFLDYLKIAPELLTADFFDKIGEEYAVADGLVIGNTLVQADFEKIKLNSKYSERTNSVYSYGIAFAMLHEMAHHQLLHLDKKEETMDEIEADASAFWSIYSDITGEDRFSANMGMLCFFYSLMMINPTLEEDGIHPREDKRLFQIYDQISSENEKYTFLVVGLIDFWAKMSDIADFPINLPPSTESIKIIKKYFNVN